MGGRANPWANSENSAALRTTSAVATNYKPQSFSDGLLELTSVDTIAELVIGSTNRVGQAEGEITLRFNDVIDNNPFIIGEDGVEGADMYSYF
jgi:hypothetical protein